MFTSYPVWEGVNDATRVSVSPLRALVKEFRLETMGTEPCSIFGETWGDLQ